MYSTTTHALQDFDNQHDFERMAGDILNALGYREVTFAAPRGGSDDGKDITFTTSRGEKGLACCTLRKDIDAKFQADFSQRVAGEFDKYILFCTAYLTHPQKVKYTKYCADNLEAEFQPYDIEALRSLLDSALTKTRRVYLHIDDDKAKEIKSYLRRLFRYPESVDSHAFASMVGLVELQTAPEFSKEIFYYVVTIDDEDLTHVPELDNALIEFKDSYYRFKDYTKKLHGQLSDAIRDNVAAQFPPAWNMYVQYFIIRCGRNAYDAARAMTGKFNYGITNEDAERVNTLISGNAELMGGIQGLILLQDAIRTRIQSLQKIVLGANPERQPGW